MGQNQYRYWIPFDDRNTALTAVAQKRGLVDLQYSTPTGAEFPIMPPAENRRILRKTFHEHLVIFTDAGTGRTGLAMGAARSRPPDHQPRI